MLNSESTIANGSLSEKKTFFEFQTQQSRIYYIGELAVDFRDVPSALIQQFSLFLKIRILEKVFLQDMEKICVVVNKSFPYLDT